MYYTYHKDISNNKWNAFQDVDGHEVFVKSFNTAEEAKAFCEEKNSAKVYANDNA